MIRRIVDHVRPEPEAARRRVDARVRPRAAQVDRERRDERLDRRAGFERVGERAVAQLVAGQAGAIVRIESGIVREREDLAVARVEHDDAARARLMPRDRRLQLRMRELLDAAVDRQLNRLAVLRGRRFADFGDHAPEPVADHFALALFTRQPRVGGKFDAFLAVVLVVREADDVRRRFSLGIEALRVGHERDAGQSLLGDPRGGIGIDLALEQHERAARVHAPQQFLRRHVEQTRDVARAVRVEQLRRRPDFVGGEAHGEHRAMAIDDPAARRGQLLRALITLLAFVEVEILVEHLHPQRAPGERGERAGHEDHDERRAPLRKAAREHRILMRRLVRVAAGRFLLLEHGRCGQGRRASMASNSAELTSPA